MPRRKAAPPAESPEKKNPAPAAETPEISAPPMPAATAATETVPESGPPKETASPAPPEAAKPLAPDGRPALVISPKGLNLRAGPAFSFDVLSVLDSGTLVLILDLPGGAKVPGWALIGAGELAGWVSDRFLRTLTE